MIYHSTKSDDYLWYLIFHRKQREKKKKKLKHTRIQSSSPFSMVVSKRHSDDSQQKAISKIEGNQHLRIYPHPVSSVNNRLYYDFSTSLTIIEKQSILIN